MTSYLSFFTFPCGAHQKDTLFKQLSDEYSYPDEESQAIYRAINQQLTMDNYYGKYHKLVFLEEMESSRKLIAE